MDQVEELVEKKRYRWEGAELKPLLLSVLIGLILWMIPVPEGLNPRAWHLFAIFLATIVGVITLPLPVGAVVLVGSFTAVATQTLSFEEMFSTYTSGSIWLIFFSFFLARGLIKTKLAKRVAYLFVAKLGKSTLGLSYGILFSELILAPFIPSLVARSGGIIFPLVLALCSDFRERDKGGDRALSTSRFLVLAAFQGSVICSGMFLTSMAANPLCVEMASEIGVEISWGTWALAASLPGLLSLLIIPYVIYKISPPDIKRTEEAPKLAEANLKELGKMSVQEWMMVGIFSIVLSLWLFGKAIGIGNATAAMGGLSLLLLLGVLSWKECLNEHTAWDTLIWLGMLITLGSQLKKLEFFTWFSQHILLLVGGFSPIVGFLVLALAYFYIHYFFASNTAHVSAMFFAFLVTATQLGAPAIVAALILGFFSNLFGGITHYGCGPAPIFFGAGFVSLKRWWGVGFICSVINIAIWGGVGSLWMRFLGLW